MKKTLLFSVTFIFAGTACAQSWNHNPSSPSGPSKWGYLSSYSSNATCGSYPVEVGKKQTPVDIVTANAIPDHLTDLQFHYKPSPFVVTNQLHTLEVDYQEGSSVVIGLSAPNTYTLLQFHLHAPSEHTINGRHTAAELHLVHQNQLGELAVVGVLLEQSDVNPNRIFDRMIFGSPVAVNTKTEFDLGGMLNAADLLPAIHRYYTYTGSLTTPPCSEGVRWFVMTQPMYISSQALSAFHSIIGQFPGYNGFPDNNRPVNPLNGRNIFVAH